MPLYPVPASTLEDWLEDYHFVCSVQAKKQAVSSDRHDIRHYFQQKYPAPLAETYWLRIRAAMLWVDRHWEDLESPWVVSGRGVNLMKEPFVSALYSAFAACSPELLGVEVDSHLVLEFAQQYADKQNNV